MPIQHECLAEEKLIQPWDGQNFLQPALTAR